MISTSVTTESIWSLLSLSWLTGPIADKELRVSSRRRRNYVLRSGYVALLALFVVVVWLEHVPHTSMTQSLMTARMSEAGKRIVVTIVQFQFYAAQLLAVVMLSTAVNDEVYRRTLGTLMTTPITGFQIVTGKLFSKLLQIVLLLAISLPLLAIIRMFGGVPWGYLVSSLCITLTAVILAGSVSLFFSIVCRRAYVVIILTVLTFLLYLLASSLGVWVFTVGTRWFGLMSTPVAAIFYLNPFAMLARNTRVMMSPRTAGGIGFEVFSHCSVMLAASAAVLFACIALVRKVALAQAAGDAGVFRRLWQVKPKRKVKIAAGTRSGGRIRRVAGPPVMWKELISRRSGREKIFVMTIIGTELAMIAALYAFPLVARFSGAEDAHAAYVAIFMGLGALSVVVFPATCITSERETRSWPLLLTTTVSDWEIIFGKFVGVLRRSLPVWVMLVVYLIPFSPVLVFGALDVAVLVVGTTVLLCGTGFYVSSCLERTSIAVAANFVLAASVWGVFHLGLALNPLARDSHGEPLLERFWATVPFLHATRMETVWSGTDYHSGEAAVYVLCYVLLGVLFAWRAKCRFRRDVFHHVL